MATESGFDVRKAAGFIASALILAGCLASTAIAMPEPVGASRVASITERPLATAASRTVADARSEALTFLGKQRAGGAFGDWRDATVDAGVAVSDTTGRPAVFVFRVLFGPRYLGYVTIDAKRSLNPVLEFSKNPAPVFASRTAAQMRVSGHDADARYVGQLYLGPLQYVVETSDPSTIAVAFAPTRELMPADRPAASSASPASMSSTASALGTTYHVIAGVPDYNQFLYRYTAAEYNASTVPSAVDTYATNPYLSEWAYYSGCTPTAASAVIKYWADHGYPTLFRDTLPLNAPLWDPDSPDPDNAVRSSRQKLINDVHVFFHTYSGDDSGWEDGTGWTFTVNITPGLVDYARAIGGFSEFPDAFQVVPVNNFSWGHYASEIASDRPVLLSYSRLNVTDPFTNEHTFYSDHSITGVGYDYTPGSEESEYLVIQDNWWDTPQDVYLQYRGSNASYWASHMVAVRPPGSARGDDVPGVPIPPSPIHGDMATGDDQGVFRVHLDAGQTIFASLAADFGFDVALFDPLARSVLTTDSLVAQSPPYGNAFQYTAPSSGDYYLDVRYSGYYPGSYTLTYRIGTATGPTFDPPAGTYVSSVDLVAITPETTGSTIHYTLDGTTPTEASPVFEGYSGLTLTKTTTVKAIALREGSTPSPVSTAVYSIVPPPPIKVTKAGFSGPIAYDLKSLLRTSFVANVNLDDVEADLRLNAAGGQAIHVGLAYMHAGRDVEVVVWDGKVDGRRLPPASYDWTLHLTAWDKDPVDVKGKLLISNITFTVKGIGTGKPQTYPRYMIKGSANCYISSPQVAVRLTGPGRYNQPVWSGGNGTGYLRGAKALKTKGTYTFSVTAPKGVPYSMSVVQ